MPPSSAMQHGWVGWEGGVRLRVVFATRFGLGFSEEAEACSVARQQTISFGLLLGECHRASCWGQPEIGADAHPFILCIGLGPLVFGGNCGSCVALQGLQ